MPDVREALSTMRSLESGVWSQKKSGSSEKLMLVLPRERRLTLAVRFNARWAGQHIPRRVSDA
jgi:ABC-type transport system involved in cytochrome c biogenesis permease component